MQDIKIKKHERIGTYIHICIPIITNIHIGYYFDSELDLLKKLEKDLKNENN